MGASPTTRVFVADRDLKDGSVRNSRNCQKGMPLSGYMKSGWQHFFD
jgi:hypothetical protein